MSNLKINIFWNIFSRFFILTLKPTNIDFRSSYFILNFFEITHIYFSVSTSTLLLSKYNHTTSLLYCSYIHIYILLHPSNRMAFMISWDTNNQNELRKAEKGFPYFISSTHLIYWTGNWKVNENKKNSSLFFKKKMYLLKLPTHTSFAQRIELVNTKHEKNYKGLVFFILSDQWE